MNGMRWERFPIFGRIALERRLWREERNRVPCGLTDPSLGAPDRPAYPIDFAVALELPYGELDREGVPFNTARAPYPATYHPTTIAQYALARWNAFLATRDQDHATAFLISARWLLTHAIPGPGGADCWPIPFAQPGFHAPPQWLSALTQGNVISALTRAYRLTGDTEYLESARRGAIPFQRDILDGGVMSSVGEGGLFFEEVAVYPAAHILNGFILAVFGLYDLVDLMGDAEIATLIDRGLATLHDIIEEFDCGSWTRYDLLNRRLASIFYQALHVALLQALAGRTGCVHCMALAKRWQGYLDSPRARRRYHWQSRARRYRAAAANLARRVYFHQPRHQDSDMQRTLVPITAFPFQGGMRSVLSGVAQAMEDDWRIEYLAGRVGPNADGLPIHSFGLRGRALPATAMVPSQFPNVWLYTLRGARKLRALLRRRRYRLILPQDGVFTGAFAAVTAKMAGVRVVSMDHGNVTLAFNRRYRAERIANLRSLSLGARLLDRLRLVPYWPSIRALLAVATQNTDMFLVSGDDVAEIYHRRLGVPAWRIVRYPYMVDVNRFQPRPEDERARLRATLDIPAEAVVVTMICRLAPEKGLDIALGAFAASLRSLPPDQAGRALLVIGGDGPLRAQVQENVHALGLTAQTRLLGELQTDQVASVLASSDIFLYTSVRGAGNPVAVLEAMATGCAVIAATQPASLAKQLDGGRGVAVPPGQPDAVRDALTYLLADEEARRDMGARARVLILAKHSAGALRRHLLRASYYAPTLATRAASGDDARQPAAISSALRDL